ncbi:hypothetical protein [Actinomadura madurae]|uniref:hypothetical protein n=1 Tax=Actinomadura madurae TaxID=1993 RepID=UPI0020D24E09|nr:hypothetical protein [Actinomadura madurae]MCP9947301.1 hypothetical protein [Actinomadura madurae]MCP9964061.1 hypothetical protein [Actinomadura madurae]MCP9976536.1 hypothetical protein [Actinomadura madurae]MCQ0011966.1 hypothetical protein [Actinomadura madurae]MCQ0012732.1 hypothetical protein [Actinomadura madurae]
MTAELEQLVELRADFPAWTIQHTAGATWPWEAMRHPGRMPTRGGFGWLHADTPGRLRELLAAAMQIEAQAATEDAAHARLEALRVRAAAAGLRAERAPGVLTVALPSDVDGPGRSEKVTCRPWPADGGKLWFFDGLGRPIVEADNVTDAVVHLGGVLWRVSR